MHIAEAKYTSQVNGRESNNMTKQSVIILAAGLGSRLRPLTNITPKCLTKINGVPIITNALQAFNRKNIKDITIVIGYLGEKIVETLGSSYMGMNIHYVLNKQYNTTNNMFSLFLGLESVTNTDTWLIEGDVIFDPYILDLENDGDITWYADSAAKNMDGCFLISTDTQKVNSLKIIRDNSSRDNAYKSMSLLHIKNNSVQKMKKWLSEDIERGRTQDYYDLIIADHLNEINCQVVDVKGYRWYEVDSLEDLLSAEKLFEGKL